MGLEWTCSADGPSWLVHEEVEGLETSLIASECLEIPPEACFELAACFTLLEATLELLLLFMSMMCQ